MVPQYVAPAPGSATFQESPSLISMMEQMQRMRESREREELDREKWDITKPVMMKEAEAKIAEVGAQLDLRSRMADMRKRAFEEVGQARAEFETMLRDTTPFENEDGTVPDEFDWNVRREGINKLLGKYDYMRQFPETAGYVTMLEKELEGAQKRVASQQMFRVAMAKAKEAEELAKFKVAAAGEEKDKDRESRERVASRLADARMRRYQMLDPQDMISRAQDLDDDAAAIEADSPDEAAQLREQSTYLRRMAEKRVAVPPAAGSSRDRLAAALRGQSGATPPPAAAPAAPAEGPARKSKYKTKEEILEAYRNGEIRSREEAIAEAKSIGVE